MTVPKNEYVLSSKEESCCPNCSYEGGRLIDHIKYNHDSFPDLEKKQKEVITGLLLGDGSFGYRNGMSVSNTNKLFLYHLNSILSPWTGSITKKVDSNKTRKIKTKDGCLHTIKSNKACYSLNIRKHPEIDDLSDWYKPSSECFPEDLTLTPTIAKYWYVSDGGLCWNATNTASATITTTNEMKRREYLESLFEDNGFSPTMSGTTLLFTREDTERLLDWMGDPPPGFEYKWINKRYFAYHDAKPVSRRQYPFSEEFDVFRKYNYYKTGATPSGLHPSESEINEEKVIQETKNIFDETDVNWFGTATREDVLLACFVHALSKMGCHIQSQKEVYKNLLNDFNIRTDTLRKNVQILRKNWQNNPKDL